VSLSLVYLSHILYRMDRAQVTELLRRLKLDESTLDRGQGAPAYGQQLADHLRQAITSDDIDPGEDLPSEQAICTAIKASRPVVRTALSTLHGERLIVKHSGLPTRIAERPRVRVMDSRRFMQTLEKVRAGEPLGQEAAFTQDHDAPWSDFSVHPIEFSAEDASPLDRKLLKLRAGTKILRRRMVKNIRNQPMEIVREAIALKAVAGTAFLDPGQQPVPGGTIAELVALGFDPRLVDQTIEGRPPNATERRLLQMQTADWVFDIVRVYTVDGKPILSSRTIAPMARTILHFQTDLTRPSGG
jgi:GntR family transcriptional regulator